MTPCRQFECTLIIQLKFHWRSIFDSFTAQKGRLQTLMKLFLSIIPATSKLGNKRSRKYMFVFWCSVLWLTFFKLSLALQPMARKPAHSGSTQDPQFPSISRTHLETTSKPRTQCWGSTCKELWLFWRFVTQPLHPYTGVSVLVRLPTPPPPLWLTRPPLYELFYLPL